MVGIADILNHSDDNDDSRAPLTDTPAVPVEDAPGMSDGVTDAATRRSRSIPRSRISKKYLTNKMLVQISIRRKLTSRKSCKLETSPGTGSISKLHINYLAAELRVKLTMASSIFSLYNSLMPHTNQKQIYILRDSQAVFNEISKNMDPETRGSVIPGRNMASKSLQLIDNNLVNLAGYSNKMLLAFSLKKDHENGDVGVHLPTFNSLDTAVSSLFGINEYTLVRVTRSTSNDHEGSVLLKLETASPGDHSLIDDTEFADEMIHSIGKDNDTPNNLFIKKIVARPRYKSDMKVYLIPKIQNISLYIDGRMLERDLINGVIDVDLLPSVKSIYCTFKFDHILNLYKNLLSLSRLDEEHNEDEGDGKVKEES